MILYCHMYVGGRFREYTQYLRLIVISSYSMQIYMYALLSLQKLVLRVGRVCARESLYIISCRCEHRHCDIFPLTFLVHIIFVIFIFKHHTSSKMAMELCTFNQVNAYILLFSN